MLSHTVQKPAKGERVPGESRGASLAAIGLEAEFSVVMDGHQVRPEELFHSPTNIVRAPMMHRTGRSYHLPTGGAIYFDTGVVELATPMIEIERGCAARAGRSLWESIRFVRRELDAWEARHNKTVHLAGFSTHYNVSFELPQDARGTDRSDEKLSFLLPYIIGMPVMLLAANRRSTGIGVRPRGNRVEITADFTPDAALMIATATLVVSIVRAVMQWPSYDVDQLEAHDLPVLRDFTPEAHSSRHGWVARYSSFPVNPFDQDVNAPIWRIRGRSAPSLSLRQFSDRVIRAFWPRLEQLSDRRSLRLIESVLDGRTPALLELPDRPAAYESVGHLCTWSNLFPVRALPRSRYERVFIRAISGRKLRLGNDWYTPVGMQGWSHVVFRRQRDNTRHPLSLDFLLEHLSDWEVGARTERRLSYDRRQRLCRRN